MFSRASFRSLNHAPANQRILIVKHRRLSRRDRALRFIQRDDQFIRLRRRQDGGGRGGVAIADFDAASERLAQAFHCDQIDLLHGEARGEQVVIFADDDRVRVWPNFDDVTRAAERDAQALALPDGGKSFKPSAINL